MKMNQSQLADRLGISTRRVRQLEDLGVVVAEGRGRYDAENNARRYSAFATKDQAAVLIEIEDAAGRVEHGLAQLAKRFAIVAGKAIGADINALDAAWKLSISMRADDERSMLDTIREAAVLDAWRRLFDIAQHHVTAADLAA